MAGRWRLQQRLAAPSDAQAWPHAKPPALTAPRFMSGAEAKWLHRNPESDPDVARHFKKGELEKLCSLDFHFKEVKNRFKKLGL